ncbi:C-C motif chemokine 26 [Cynocephalus volans]|uniref:C-C motif chemokine 26 n=1 Tax=Cynocephalus volans TaxID=110931 RepID=UPI002FC99F15
MAQAVADLGETNYMTSGGQAEQRLKDFMKSPSIGGLFSSPQMELCGPPEEDKTGSCDLARSCSFQYSRRVIPWVWVQTYEYASSSCSQKTIHYYTKRGKKICAQLKEKWVQRYISLSKTQQQL